ncbi:hypothetical protein XELAEV_18028928mg [Xenopus laevis]|uniref:Uncharacterized protein n=1 Tax=Xenopus laevis TaxID=8355 RepID=A0A974CT19_XENLA|nr:hypothetical protein XELAEV_18028928mg [Xenopus laevis]
MCKICTEIYTISFLLGTAHFLYRKPFILLNLALGKELAVVCSTHNESLVVYQRSVPLALHVEHKVPAGSVMLSPWPLLQALITSKLVLSLLKLTVEIL